MATLGACAAIDQNLEKTLTFLKNQNYSRILCCIFLFFFTLFTGCGPKPETIAPPIEEPEEFSVSGTAVIPDRWWLSFDDPVLTGLVDKALGANFILKQNWQGFRAALAGIEHAEADLWPQIGATAGAVMDRSESGLNQGEHFRLGLAASYEVDLWGRIRAGIQAEKFRARAAFFDYRAAGMSISAETAVTWYALVTARKQLALTKEQIATNEDIVRLIRARFAGGQIRAVDILRQEQLLERTRAQLISYETQIALLRNRLAVLLGRPPQDEENIPEGDLPDLPPLPETGLPLELVRRRPDVQQAYYLLMAADREMAVAVTNRYPRLSLDLTADMITEAASSLFRNWAYSLAGNLAAPLLYGGRLQAEVERTEALTRQQLYVYGQTVLEAFREVEDALLQERQQQRQIEVMQRQLELAQKTSNQLRIEFLNGLSDYLDVLLALDEQQQLQRDVLTAQLDLLEIRISLYRALAGGFETQWETQQLESENEQ